MRIQRSVLLVALLAIVPGIAHAQDFGVMESAETINHRNFKIRVSPMLIFGKDQDREIGVALYDGVTFFGANAEVWIAKEEPIDFSIAGGLHFRTGDRTIDLTGADVTFLASGHATRRLEIYGGLDLAFEALREPGSFKTVHFVPGIEYRISDSLDFVAELGIGLNDSARHYLSGGLAFYIR